MRTDIAPGGDGSAVTGGSCLPTYSSTSAEAWEEEATHDRSRSSSNPNQRMGRMAPAMILPSAKRRRHVRQAHLDGGGRDEFRELFPSLHQRYPVVAGPRRSKPGRGRRSRPPTGGSPTLRPKRDPDDRAQSRRRQADGVTFELRSMLERRSPERVLLAPRR